MTDAPTFIAKFADGTVTRMTTHRSPARPDLRRGVKLSIAAYKSRKKTPPPAIVEARFVELGSNKVLKEYDTAALKKVQP